jgi:hypothetical protein
VTHRGGLALRPGESDVTVRAQQVERRTRDLQAGKRLGIGGRIGNLINGQ